MIKDIKQKGFTIVETMIVLAIVGAIMLVVLLAVPALQRNSRNTGLKSDVSLVLAGINEFVTNNSGKMPTSVAGSSGTLTITGATGTTQATVSIRGSTTVTTGTAAPALTTTDSMVVVLGFKCNGNALGSASTRSTAVLFNIEGSTTNALMCQET
jgi:prepilin-type N-terminal cleavage/methylation domain-containing protein